MEYEHTPLVADVVDVCMQFRYDQSRNVLFAAPVAKSPIQSVAAGLGTLAKVTATAPDPIVVEGLAINVRAFDVAVAPAATTMLTGSARRVVVPFSNSRNS